MTIAASTKDRIPAVCSEECLLRPNNTNCGGCGMSVALTMLGRLLREADEKAMLTIPACCGIVTAGGYPTSSYGVPVLASTFGSSPAFATGMAAVRDLNGEDGQVIDWAGDGGTYDIGMATLSAAAERNENFLYICYDNEIYGNTGGQRSSATPVGARTSTSPFGKRAAKKDVMGIVIAHRVPYAATLSMAHPEDFDRKVERALTDGSTRADRREQRPVPPVRGLRGQALPGELRARRDGPGGVLRGAAPLFARAGGPGSGQGGGEGHVRAPAGDGASLACEGGGIGRSPGSIDPLQSGAEPG
ncbi:MAG: thiamine pyrophosphate-dependent enzyme [Planctomycetota bacterium]|jgi:hypothetical protein